MVEFAVMVSRSAPPTTEPEIKPKAESKHRVAHIAFQGVSGAFSQQAALQFLPDAATVGYPTFFDGFQAAVLGRCDYACLPVENSLAGSINQTYDLLTDSVLHVIGEQVVRVEHTLLAPPGTTLKDVKRVYSHTQALEQCRGYLAKHGFEAVTDFDTAGAAKLLGERMAAGTAQGHAAIASKRSAEIYGLEVLAENIEDMDFNYTRFFILGPDEVHREANAHGGPHKSSLVIATRHRPGDLVRCLELFPQNGINMTKLESRPRRDKPWSYLFYIDIEGHIEDDNVREAMTRLMRRAAFVKFLGSYPAAPTIAELSR